MKSKTLFVIGILLSVAVLTGEAVETLTEGPSFREQILHAVQLRDAGEITDQEYRSLKKHIIRAMRH